jgi:transcriptional regulator with XRE-family HTH domain
LGLTLERLAWECDLAKPFVWQIEAGRRLPSIPVLFVLAARLGTKASVLLDFDPHTRKSIRSKGANDHAARPRSRRKVQERTNA